MDDMAKRILRGAISKGKPFAEMEPGVRKVMEGVLDSWIKTLVTEAQGPFDKLLQDFDPVFTVLELPNAEREKLRNAIRDFVEKTKKTFQGPMAAELRRATEEPD